MCDRTRHDEAAATIDAAAPDLFEFLDEHRNLSSHMDERSWMMAGSRMTLHADAGGARRIGSRFGFTGSVLGLPLAVEEVVAVREPPRRKAWQTVGAPLLWVIGSYRMGFEIAQLGRTARLRVFIDYALPERGIARLLGRLFAGFYAHWCVGRMVADAQKHFRRHSAGSPAAAGLS